MSDQKKVFYYNKYEIEEIVDFDSYSNPDGIRLAYVREYNNWLIEWIMAQKLVTKNAR
jgi:hypothetical protein